MPFTYFKTYFGGLAPSSVPHLAAFEEKNSADLKQKLEETNKLVKELEAKIENSDAHLQEIKAVMDSDEFKEELIKEKRAEEELAQNDAEIRERWDAMGFFPPYEPYPQENMSGDDDYPWIATDEASIQEEIDLNHPVWQPWMP